MGIRGKEAIHGIIKLLDEKNNEEFSGTGVMFTDEGKIYASIARNGKPKTLVKYRIIFIANNSAKVYVSINYHANFFHFDMGNRELVFDMKNYIIADDMKTATQVLNKGISGIYIYIDCKSKDSKTIIKHDKNHIKLESLSFGSTGKICSREYKSGFSITLNRTFRSNFGNNQIDSQLCVGIKTKNNVLIEDWQRLMEPFELYWDLFKSETSLNINRIQFISIDENDTYYLGAIAEKNKLLSIEAPKALLIESPDINPDILEKILVAYENGPSNKLCYGLSKYMYLRRKNRIDTQMAVLYTSAALDSITAEISKEKIPNNRKKKIKADIKEIVDYISQQEKFEQETKDFYINDINKIYEKLRNGVVKDAIKKTAEKLKIDYNESMRESIKIVFNARNQIIHGQSYKIEELLPELNGYNIIKEEVSNGGMHTSFTYDYKFGSISNALSLIKEIGKKKFE